MLPVNLYMNWERSELRLFLWIYRSAEGRWFADRNLKRYRNNLNLNCFTDIKSLPRDISFNSFLLFQVLDSVFGTVTFLRHGFLLFRSFHITWLWTDLMGEGHYKTKKINNIRVFCVQVRRQFSEKCRLKCRDGIVLGSIFKDFTRWFISRHLLTSSCFKPGKAINQGDKRSRLRWKRKELKKKRWTTTILTLWWQDIRLLMNFTQWLRRHRTQQKTMIN